MKKFVFLLLAILLSATVFGEYEHIISYNSFINVNEDGSLLVREKIKVYSEGVNIMHGIYRDFPLNYIDKKNNRYRVDFSIVEVRKDGEAEPYFTKNSQNGIRIYIGSKDVFLAPDYYEYEIVFTTDRQIGYFKTYDEIYWNVTGNDWIFDIDSASCTITLPEKADVSESQFAGYTGYRGESGDDYTASIDSAANSITFRMTRKLNYSEGLTVAVSLKKGALKEVSVGKKIYYILKDNIDLLIGLIGLIFIFIYFLYMWKRVGKDPERLTVIPQFEPPSGISSGDARFIKKMAFDNKIIVSEMVNLAVKKHLKIEKEKNKYVITYLPGEEKLNEFEESVKSIIFGYGQRIVLDNKNHAEISAIINGIQSKIKERSEGSMFKNNFGESGTGCFFSILLVILIFLISPFKPVMGLVFSLIFTFAIFGLWSAVNKFKTLSKSKKQNLRTGASLFMTGLLIVLIIAVCIPFAYYLFIYPIDKVIYKPFLNMFFIALFMMNAVFFDIMRSYTDKGAEMLSKIEGFKMYLDSTDEAESALSKEISMNQELFEKYLPFAIALDAESVWAKKFEDSLNVTDNANRIHYYPVWYHADNFNVNSFASSFSSSMSSAISSSSQAPGSSSGSGGGGSSGGGGGGGGGGGW